MKTTKLFKVEDIKKFFSILDRMERGISTNKTKDIYEGRCQKEIFVQRTINKWLAGKYVILYSTSPLDILYKRYLCITKINFVLGWGTELNIRYWDAAQPVDISNSMILTHNDILRLEGSWDLDRERFNEIVKLFIVDEPEKEYVFKTYNFDKYPKRKKKGQTEDDIKKLMEGQISFFGKTEYEAIKEKERYDKSKKDRIIIFPDIHEIKEKAHV